MLLLSLDSDDSLDELSLEREASLDPLERLSLDSEDSLSEESELSEDSEEADWLEEDGGSGRPMCATPCKGGSGAARRRGGPRG